jgi:hypothetical protein
MLIDRQVPRKPRLAGSGGTIKVKLHYREGPRPVAGNLHYFTLIISSEFFRSKSDHLINRRSIQKDHHQAVNSKGYSGGGRHLFQFL